MNKMTFVDALQRYFRQNCGDSCVVVYDGKRIYVYGLCGHRLDQMLKEEFTELLYTMYLDHSYDHKTNSYTWENLLKENLHLGETI